MEDGYNFWNRNKTYKEFRAVPNGSQRKLEQTMKATMRATLGGGIGARSRCFFMGRF